MGFRILATGGTSDILRRNGIDCVHVYKQTGDDDRPEGAESVVDLINSGQVDLIINTPKGDSGSREDGYGIRAAAVSRGIPCVTTVSGAGACVQGIEALRGEEEFTVYPLQELHRMDRGR